jgi:putative transposase
LPRQARKKSSTGIYHIIIRGINHQVVFHDEEDYARFHQTLRRYKEKSAYEIYAYCLMDNHVHLLLKVNQEPLEQIMRRICGSYVYWYNAKYQRIGNLFQDRFKSEAVEDDRYLLTVLRYIHQNPLIAGIVQRIENYPWSSMREYLGEAILVDAGFALEFFHSAKEKAVESLYQFCEAANDDVCHVNWSNSFRIFNSAGILSRSITSSSSIQFPSSSGILSKYKSCSPNRAKSKVKLTL